MIAVTKMNANPLETLLTSMNAPVAFTGFPGGSADPVAGRPWRPEAVLNNQVQRAMNLFFRLCAGHHPLTVPVVTLIAFLTGNELRFWPWRPRRWW